MKIGYYFGVMIMGILPCLSMENDVPASFSKNGVLFQKFERKQDLPQGLEELLKSKYVEQRQQVLNQLPELSTKEWSEKLDQLKPDFSLIVAKKDEEAFASFFLEPIQLARNITPLCEHEVGDKIEIKYGTPFVKNLKCLAFTGMTIWNKPVITKEKVITDEDLAKENIVYFKYPEPTWEKNFYFQAIDCGDSFYPKTDKFFFPMTKEEEKIIRETEVMLFNFRSRGTNFFGSPGEYPLPGEEFLYKGALLEKYPKGQWRLMFFHR